MAILTEKEKLKVKLKGDYETDSQFLMKSAEKFAAEGNMEAANSASELIMEIMPEKQRLEIERLTYVEGKRLDTFYGEILQLIKNDRKSEALTMSKVLYDKVMDAYKETDSARFVCLRNSFEDNICQLLHKFDKTLNRAPFDLSRYLTTYGYLLVDFNKIDDAVKVLKEAEEFNPVDCGPKFELAEAYKLSKDTQALLDITKETLKVASSPYALSRCYCNLGFYAVEVEEYDDAAVFYYTSLIFAAHPAVEGELAHLAHISGKKLTPSDKQTTDAVFEKYGISYGAEEMIISVAAQLANNALTANNIREGLIYLKILYGVTNDPEIRDVILKYDPDAEKRIDEMVKRNFEESQAN